jgi:tetratricopeptide (TPR) repeat protein
MFLLPDRRKSRFVEAMKWIVLSCVILASLLSAASPTLARPDCIDSACVAIIKQAQVELFNDRFAAADSIYREGARHHPSNPAWSLFRAGLLFSEMADREENFNPDLFEQLLDSVEAQTERIIDTCDAPTAAWMYLFRGHAKAYASLWEARFGSLLGALRQGLATIGEFESGLEEDSSLYDLYAGIGSYHYWKSTKAGLLSKVGIFKDEKEKGIVELRVAVDSSLLHREFARSALIWIWLDKKEFDSSIALSTEFVRRYPDTRTFRWPWAQALFRQTKYREAAEVFEDIRDRISGSPGNYHNLIQCDYYLTKCYNWLSDFDRTQAAAMRVAGYHSQIPSETLARQRFKLNFLARIAKR